MCRVLWAAGKGRTPAASPSKDIQRGAHLVTSTGRWDLGLVNKGSYGEEKRKFSGHRISCEPSSESINLIREQTRGLSKVEQRSKWTLSEGRLVRNSVRPVLNCVWELWHSRKHMNLINIQCMHNRWVANDIRVELGRTVCLLWVVTPLGNILLVLMFNKSWNRNVKES